MGKALTWTLVFLIGFVAPGCRSLKFVALDDLTEDEKERLLSSEGLPVKGYRSDRGTRFGEEARARVGPTGSVEFTPAVPTDLFPGPVHVERDRIAGVGRSRFSPGKTIGGILLIPLLIIPAALTGGEALNNFMDVASLGGTKDSW